MEREAVENGAGEPHVARARVGRRSTVFPGMRDSGTMLIEQSLPEAQIERRFERDGFICAIKIMLHSKAEHEVDKSTLN